MKKELKLSLLFMFFAIAIVGFLSFASAQPTNPSDVAGEQLGFNPDQLDPGELQRNYLQQEWSKVVTGWPVIGPMHTFFIAHPLIFRILFSEPYSFSLTFFFIFIIWLIVLINLKKITSATKSIFEKKWAAWLAGVLFTIILAQSGVYKAITNFVIDLILNKQNFWVRAALWLVFCVALILIYYFGDMISKQLKASKEAKEKAATEHAGKVVQQTAEGITKG